MLKYKDLYDYILNVLYQLKRTNGHHFFSLKGCIEHLMYDASLNEIVEIGKYLEAEGYIQAEYIIGDVFVEITPPGIMHIEDKEENFSVDFEKYLANKKVDKNNFKNISKLSSDTIKNSRKPYLEMVEKIIEELNDTEQLKNSDLQKDARILKLELEKESINKETLLIKLNSIQDFQPFNIISAELKHHIQHSFG